MDEDWAYAMSSDHIVEPWRPTSYMDPDTTFRHRRPVHDLVSTITPTVDHFVLSHFGNARIDLASWRLEVGGLVDREATLSLEELRAFPKHEVQSVLQCGGFPDNPRINTHNASNAIWAGADLGEVLQHVGVDRRTSYIWSFAPDHGTYADWSADYYVKDLPIERVQQGGVLLAYEVNGKPLTAEHGFPLRLFVPGFYGTNSVKWLCRITAADHRAPGLFSSELYNDPVPSPSTGAAQRVPVWEVAPDSIIVSPRQNERIAGASVNVWGWTWAAEEIAAVDVSLDEGRTWHPADVARRVQHSWQRFDFDGSAESTGKTVIITRATDVHGTCQPLQEARNCAHRISVVLT